MPYRRACQRFLLNDSVSLITKDGIEKRLLLKDLSATGAGVLGECLFKAHEKATVIINAPAFFKKPIHRVARIAWCRKIDLATYESGLDFGYHSIEEIGAGATYFRDYLYHR